MSTKPNVEARQPKSQATPLSEDVLSNLRRQIMSGAMGTGFQGLRGGSDAIKQFVNSRSTMENFNELASPLINLSNQNTDRQAADLRENFSIAGSRFGTPAAFGEARLRGDAQTNLDATLANLFQSEQQNLLSGIGLMGQLGMSNLMPFLQMSQLGILPEDTIVSDSGFTQLLSALSGIAQGAGAAVGAV